MLKACDKINVVVLVSGGGTNLQALIDAQKNKKLGRGEITHVISSKPDVFALERARKNGIKSSVVERKGFANDEDYSCALLKKLDEIDAQLIVLAGFLSILSERFVNEYSDRIVNVHPSLIPSFCGKGFYGLKVHEAALKYGVKVSGATVHLVNEVVDGGKIICQKAVDVLPDDTPLSLQKRIMVEAEQVLLPLAVMMICDGL